MIILIKTAGLALIFSACVYAGFEAAASCRRRLKLGEALIAFLSYIKSQIEYLAAPLDQIYSNFQCPTLEKYGFCEALISGGFDTAVSLIKPQAGEDIYASLVSFGAGLGKSGKQSQVELCDYHISQLGDICRRLKNELPQKTRLYTSISFMAALTAVIIFI